MAKARLTPSEKVESLGFQKCDFWNLGCECVNFVHKKSKNFVERKLDLMVQVYPLRKNTRVTVKKHIYGTD